MRAIVVILWLALAKSARSQGAATPGSPAANQLKEFAKTTKGPIGTLTTTTGRLISIDELSTVNNDLITNGLFMEQISALNRERVPVRIVHGKAAGAFGTFKVTHDVTKITNAAFLSKVGKTTPVAVRVGAAFSEKGSPDPLRGPFGFATKFYTEEGNFDFMGFSTDTFLFKDPLFFLYSVHTSRRNPKTHLQDPNAQFDFLSYRPEAFNTVLQFFGDIGVPASYRHLASYSIHTFQVENEKQEVSYVRFKMTPDIGVKTMNQSETVRLAGSSPNIFTEDLYDHIASGKHPSWTFGMQVISKADVEKAKFDIFDVTFRWPEDKYPVKPIGKLVLNKNPDDHHRDVELMALSPGNLVPGFQGCDKLWEGRAFAYRDAQLYRLGVNFNEIDVNRPKNKVYTYTRDGVAPVRDTFGGMPIYYPNSFNGPIPANVTRTRTERVKVHTDPGFTNAAQIAEYYKGLHKDSKQRLVENLSRTLALTYQQTQDKILKIFGGIDAQLKSDMEKGLTKAKAVAKK